MVLHKAATLVTDEKRWGFLKAVPFILPIPLPRWIRTRPFSKDSSQTGPAPECTFMPTAICNWETIRGTNKDSAENLPGLSEASGCSVAGSARCSLALGGRVTPGKPTA